MVEFEWDASKEEENIRKHGVSFSKSVESFFDPQGIQLVDKRHSRSEIFLGRKESDRTDFDDVVHASRREDSDYRLRGMEEIQEALP